MAKLAATVTIFFFLIALSHARFPVDLTENDRSTYPTESNPKTNANLIFLPSDKPEAKAEEFVNKLDTKKPEPDSSESKTVATTSFEPVTVINFRPITRQLPRRPSVVFRHRRPCRHHTMRNPWIMAQPGRTWSRFENREVSYGKDMLTMSDAASNKKAEHPRWFRNDEQVKVRHIPARWVHFHDGDADQFPFKIEDVEAMMKKEEKEDLMRPRHDDHHGHHHHHHHHHQHDHDGEEEMREGREHGNVLLKKIRKFLTHF